ncbi:MAG: TonB-dependent receptor [Gammaproteobacteria bacterium]|nr:TonB-dependent receptor [Gammaproteobacteria bacterium]
MSESLFHCSRISFGLSLGFALALQPAAAQSTIDQIIVTSKIREQSLFDVPLSIAVVDEESVKQLGIRDMTDLDRWVPSLNIRSPSGRRASTITMRGLSPNTTSEQLRGVSFFVDGIYVSGSIGSLRMEDVERVEVIRGPQTAMFGRATYTGAVDLVTHTPKPENLSGKVDASFSQYSVGDTPRWQLEGTVSFPIIQNRLWASLSAVMDETDSFAQTPTGSAGVGGQETTAYGGVLYWEATDDLSLKLRYNRSEDEDEASFVHITHPDEWIAAGVNTSVVGDNTIWPDGETLDPIAGVTECQPFYGAGPTPGAVGRGTPRDCGEEQTRDFVSLIADYDLSGYTLSYRGAYLKSELDSNGDQYPRGNIGGVGVDPFFGPGNGIAPGGKTSAGFIATYEEFENTSHQLRVVSPAGQRLRWLAGLYYFDEENTNYRVDNFVPLSSYTGSITGVNEIQDRGADELENIATFGQVEYDLTDQLTASFEARYQRETIEKKQCPDCRQASYGDTIGQDLKESENEFLPRVTLSWTPSAGQTFFALYSEGTKSARFNTTEPTGYPGNFADAVYVKPEELKNYEVGAKNSFLDSRLRTSFSLFYMDVENQQQSAQLPNSTISFTQNVAESEVTGFEFEVFASITDRLSANLAIGYADHEYKNDFVPGSALDRRIVNGRSLEGKTSPGVPKTTVVAGAMYTMPVMTDYELTMRVDASYRSKAYIDLVNQGYVGDSTLVNLATDFGKDTWTVSLFAHNLFEDETSPGNFSGTSTCSYRNAAFTTFTSALQRCSGLGISRGREVGLSAAFNF